MAESGLDDFVLVAFWRSDDELPLDQLEILVLGDDARLDHAADFRDGERPAGETFGGAGGYDIHTGIPGCFRESS